MSHGTPVPPPAGATGNLWANLGLPPPASTPTAPVFSGFGVGSKKQPNAGLLAYIGAAEGKADMVQRLADVYDAKVRRLGAAYTESD